MKRKSIFMATLLALTLFVTSCTTEKPTTYSVKNSTSFDAKGFVYECNDLGEKINVTSTLLASGEQKIFTANENATKVKIYIDELDKWVQQVYYLKIEGHINIVISNDTIVGSKEP